MSGTRVALRIAVVVTVAAGLLAPSIVAPARTLSIPITQMRGVLLSSAQPKARLSFRPTHIAFSWRGDEGTGVRYRTTKASGGHTKWRRAPEAHDAERGDRHFSAVLAVRRPVAVEYEPIRPRGKAMSTVVLDYINTVDGPRRTVRVPALAQAAANVPRIVTRAEWGANERIRRKGGSCKPRFYPVQQLFVHHTAGRNADPNPPATMRAIYSYHVQRQGWCDIGYNFVIGSDGTIFEGRWARGYAPWEIHSSENIPGRRAVAGAHVSGFNSGSVGVSLMGNFTSTKPLPVQRRALAEFLAWEADRHRLNPLGSHVYRNPETGRTKKLPFIAGHRDAGSTACPGARLYRVMGGVRQDTAAVIGGGKVSSVLSLSAFPRQVPAGQPVELSGVLRDRKGAALAGRPVTIYQRPARAGWSPAGEVITGIDGSFRLTFRPGTTTRVRAVYDGDPETWGAQSWNSRVVVTPAPTASPSPSYV